MKYLLLLAMIGCVSCANMPEPDFSQSVKDAQKIELDLSRLDENGLRGPANGKVAVSYEFAIPNTPACRKEVKAIDPSVQLMAGSRGRIGAKKGECLCIGTTGKGYRQVFEKLAGRPYIARIIECHFE